MSGSNQQVVRQRKRAKGPSTIEENPSEDEDPQEAAQADILGEDNGVPSTTSKKSKVHIMACVELSLITWVTAATQGEDLDSDEEVAGSEIGEWVCSI